MDEERKVRGHGTAAGIIRFAKRKLRGGLAVKGYNVFVFWELYYNSL